MGSLKNPVVLCVTDKISAMNWTMYTCKKSIIEHNLGRFFCGLLIGSEVGINAKWISTVANKIADDISRLKKVSPQLQHHPLIMIFLNSNRTMRN